ncbi:hypothetical protein [Kingella denitrificans]
MQAAFHRPETPIQPTDVHIRGAAFEHELPFQKQPALSNKLNIKKIIKIRHDQPCHSARAPT